MKRFFCILIILCLALTICASAESPGILTGSFPDLSSSMPDMPGFSGFNVNDWPSGFTMPEGWEDLDFDSFEGFPEGWDDQSGSGLEEWEERFDSFRDQVSGQSMEHAFPDWDMSDFDKLKEAFERSGSGQEDTGITEDIRDLFTSAFGEINDQPIEPPEIITDAASQKPAIKYTDTTVYRQLSAIAGAIGFAGFSSDLPLNSLPEFSSNGANQNPDTVKKLFSDNAEQLAVTMDVSSDRYCSLFATGKDNQAASDAKVNEALHSLYDSMQ